MPPPSLSRTTNVASTPRRAAPSSPPASWRNVRSPHRATTGSPALAAPRTVDTKPSMPLTPRFDRNRSPDRGRAKDSTSRTGMLDPTTSVVPDRRPATRSRATRPSNGSDQESSRRSSSRRAARSAEQPRRQPEGLAAGRPSGGDGVEQGGRVGDDALGRRAVGVEPGAVGVDEDLAHGRVEPRRAGPAGERRAEPEDDVGPQGLQHPGRPQQGVVGGDGIGALAGARERVGQHRPLGGGGEPLDRVGVHAGAPPDHDHAPGLGRDQEGQAVDVGRVGLRQARRSTPPTAPRRPARAAGRPRRPWAPAAPGRPG